MARCTRQTVTVVGLAALLLVVGVGGGYASSAGSAPLAGPTDAAGPLQVAENETSANDTATADVTETETSANDTTAEENVSRVRAVHVSPAVPDLEVEVGFETVASNLSFGETSAYTTVDPGEESFEITRLDTDEEIFETDEEIQPGTAYTVLAVARITDNQSLTFVPALLVDDFGDLPASDEASLRFVHAAQDVEAVDVTVAGTDTTIADNVSFREPGSYVTVPAGNHTIELREEAPQDDGEVIHEAELDLEGGTVYTATAIGFENAADAPVDFPLEVGLFEDVSLNDSATD